MANLTQTTTSGAVTRTQMIIPVTSATGISAPVNNIRQQIYIYNPESIRGELMDVIGVSGTQISVSRNSLFRQHINSGSIVIIGVSPTAQSQGFASFFETDPVGGITTAAAVLSVPYINATNGNQWLRSVDGIWVPGFCNDAPNRGTTTAVASAAGLITPSGPLFHVTGALAVTGFTIPVGFSGGSFTIIPDGAFTWTNANNIAIAGTAVVSRALTFTYDSSAAKPFYPSYV